MSTTTDAPAGTATTTTWNIDPAHTHVEFAVKHMMIATVKGRFTDIKGTVVVDEANPASAKIDVTIAATSLDTRQEQRDGHLRSADFFDVERFPTIRFVSRKIARDGDGYRVTGDLTIRDATREITLAVDDEGRGRDPWGITRAGFTGTAKIHRKDFGLVWNQPLESGGLLVGDEVKISVDVELVKA
jgi:polyisoprenoid-binding protein YceI